MELQLNCKVSLLATTVGDQNKRQASYIEPIAGILEGFLTSAMTSWKLSLSRATRFTRDRKTIHLYCLIAASIHERSARRNQNLNIIFIIYI